jgi:hypothetical protein
MKPTKYMIQSAGGLATTLIRQKPADEILQYKPQNEQTRVSMLPVHADWTTKDVAWTRLSTQNRMTRALSMQAPAQKTNYYRMGCTRWTGAWTVCRSRVVLSSS